jgi:N6-adenosine-specific RNA methylase IME4
MKDKMQVVVCDPPYEFSDKLQNSDVPRGAEANYPTLTIEELAKLPIADIADPAGSLLDLWVPSSMIADGIRLMTAWGFEQKQIWVWAKTKIDPFEDLRKTLQVAKKKPEKIDEALQFVDRFDFNSKEDSILSFGMGRLGRNAHEIVLIGVRGKIYDKLEDKSQRTVFFAPNLKHSQKPEVLQDKLEAMFPTTAGKRMEIFARRERAGWNCFGNEIDGKDIRDALNSFVK